MRDMTAANLRSAFGGESQAHMRYIIWGDIAGKEGFKNIANLFKAISYAEQIHATNHFNALKDVKGAFLVASGAGFGIGKTVENLDGAMEGEHFEITEMYPAYKEVAKFQNESQAVNSFNFALETEKIHYGLYKMAKEAASKGQDINVEKVSICEVCGYTADGTLPDKCPLCGATKDKFKIFD